jgi:hypothetical protein
VELVYRRGMAFPNGARRKVHDLNKKLILMKKEEKI